MRSADIEVSEESLKEIETVIRAAGVNLEGESKLGSWVGGRVVLVPTDGKIEDWKAVALRDL